MNTYHIPPHQTASKEDTTTTTTTIDDLLSENPTQTPSKKVRYKKRKPIYKDHLDYLIKLIDQDVNDPIKNFNLKILCYILYYTGLRISEALALSHDQLVKFINGESINVFTSKTDSYRQLINTKAIYDDLQYFRDHQNEISELGFVNCHGKELKDRRAEKYLYPLLTKVELHFEGKLDHPSKRLYNSHSFRVGFINRLLKHFPIHDVSYVVGHCQVATTIKYTRQNQNIDRYNDYLRDKSF